MAVVKPTSDPVELLNELLARRRSDRAHWTCSDKKGYWSDGFNHANKEWVAEVTRIVAKIEKAKHDAHPIPL